MNHVNSEPSVHLPREIPNRELDEGAVGDVVLLDLVGGLQEESLVGGHLVEDHLLDRALATSPESHEEDLWSLLGSSSVSLSLEMRILGRGTKLVTIWVLVILAISIGRHGRIS